MPSSASHACPHHRQDGRVAADDEGQGAKASYPVGYPNGQLPVQILGAALKQKFALFKLFYRSYYVPHEL